MRDERKKQDYMYMPMPGDGNACVVLIYARDKLKDNVGMGYSQKKKQVFDLCCNSLSMFSRIVFHMEGRALW